MRRGLVGQKATGKKISRIIVRAALFLSLLAVIFIVGVVLTTQTTNKIMSVSKKSLENIPSNILPPYSPTNFLSFDGQTNLSGWFFKIDDPISTIILVHDFGSNRMEFDVETVDLVEDFLKANFNVFLFDLRNSGESSGEVNGFGYLEWQDVIGAISHVRKISVTKNVILYGVAGGCASALMAVDKLPAPGEYAKNIGKKIQELAYDQSYIAGLILDSPAKNMDDYIKPRVKEQSNLGFLLQNTVPYAIRVSAGEGKSLDISSLIARLPIPVCILYGDHDTYIGSNRIAQMVTERQRLHPNTTTSHVFFGANYGDSFQTDSITYSKIIINFLEQNYASPVK